jgi:hypothetical protein
VLVEAQNSFLVFGYSMSLMAGNSIVAVESVVVVSVSLSVALFLYPQL